ncbi:hypothetical protein GJJ64_03420 [Pedobacter sp. HX-22-1]|uniref:Uncharacterized protein n=1 Tax=Pedobacter puniceum TaxID=2666136 RepID=A0A7K0FLY1_9SPHI|nr:hypothetical protein [Pedobacter puniceum]MRX46230.1 hypothetical protein [Pedobacter puniceum]
MKANHNRMTASLAILEVVVNISSSKNESKSQQNDRIAGDFRVVVNISSSKNESKSQQQGYISASNISCCKYQ